MSARSLILDRVRENQPQGDYPLPSLPHFPFDDGGDRAAMFLANLEAMGGIHYPGADLAEVVRDHFSSASVIASSVPEFRGNRELGAVVHPRELADVDVAIVRALLGVAETGSVLLTDDALKVNVLACLAQHLVVLLDPSAIIAGLQDAYRQPEFADYPYLSFHTGPSATADIEGVLIHGAQGVRSLSLVFAPAA